MKTAEDLLAGKSRDLLTIQGDKTILQACRLMVDNKIGAVLVEEGEKVVGIWTERDLLRNILVVGFDPETARIRTYMTSPLRSVPHDATLPQLEDMILGLRIRHILVEKNGRYIGVLSIGDVLRANLIDKDKKIKELHSAVSWQYYEDWKWDRPKKS